MDQAFRRMMRRELIGDLNAIPYLSMVEAYGSRLLLLNPHKIELQYQELNRCLPQIDHHFAIKALRHPAAIAAVDDCGGFFDVMTNSDVDLVHARNISPDRCIHTNPIKELADIAYAYDYGIRTFVV